MRVVFDTNVLISVLLFGGELGILRDLIKQGFCVPCFSPSTLDELADVVSRDKFRVNLADYGYQPDIVVRAVQEKGLLYPDRVIERVIHEDPEDDKFLACALASQASFIISGDRHLLALGLYRDIPIITPREFLRKINA